MQVVSGTPRRSNYGRWVAISSVVTAVAMISLWLLGTTRTLPAPVSMNIAWVPGVVQVYFLYHWERGRNLREALHHAFGGQPPR